MNPDSVQLEIAIPQLRKLLDAREEVVPLRLVIVFVLGRQNLLLERKQKVILVRCATRWSAHFPIIKTGGRRDRWAAFQVLCEFPKHVTADAQRVGYQAIT